MVSQASKFSKDERENSFETSLHQLLQKNKNKKKITPKKIMTVYKHIKLKKLLIKKKKNGLGGIFRQAAFTYELSCLIKLTKIVDKVETKLFIFLHF